MAKKSNSLLVKSVVAGCTSSIMLLLMNCGPDFGVHNVDQEEFAYETLPKANNFFVTKITEPHINIALRGNALGSIDIEQYRNWILDAIVKFVDEVRPITTLSLIERDDITVAAERAIGTPHVTVNIEYGTIDMKPNASGGKWVNLYTKSRHFNPKDGVILHEFGHIFGLGDTYRKGIWDCKPGQDEDAIMCSPKNELQDDDITGIKEIFCAVYPHDCARRWYGNMNWCADPGELHIGDFNGDGRDDMLCHKPNNGWKYIAKATSDGIFEDTTWAADMKWCADPGELHIGDFNGDGRDDMLCHKPNNGWKYVALATTSGTFTDTTWAKDMKFCADPGKLHIGDFNGDGRDDMLCHYPDSGRKVVSLADSNGTGSFPRINWTNEMKWCADPSELHIGDFNGDGRDDMFCHTPGFFQEFLSLATSAGTFTTTHHVLASWCSNLGDEIHIGDFNDDGRDDVMCKPESSDGYTDVALSDQDGLFPGNSRSVKMKWCSQEHKEIYIGDFDFDGSSDYLCHGSDNGSKSIAYQDDQVRLGSNEIVSNSVQKKEWDFYSILSDSRDNKLSVVLSGLSSDIDLYVRRGVPPTSEEYDCRSYLGGTRSETCTLEDASDSIWFIGVHGYRAGDYSLEARTLPF